MKTKLIAAIKRRKEYSPNHIKNDEAILNLTLDYLRRRGYEINVYDEYEAAKKEISGDAIVTMGRDPFLLNKLHTMENAGIPIINSTIGIENCNRVKLTHRMISNNISYPRTLIFTTEDDPYHALLASGFEECWLKRGDHHALSENDILFARTPEEASRIFKTFAFRGLQSVVIQEHLKGDLIKFYAVAPFEYLYWFYPSDRNYQSIQGLEAINGPAKHIPFDQDAFLDLIEMASDAVGLSVVGGDCIVDEDGQISLIDLNDWPSFAPCREEAAPCIAEFIDNYFKASFVQ
jgi:glutathione synthase/RimK-type ligase-like ATP-grasp enzyme